MLLLIALLTYLPPATETLRESVDCIELNTVWHETTCETDPLQYRIAFQQFLFREWNDFTGNHEIIAWRILKDFDVNDEPFGTRKKTNMLPERVNGVWVMRWRDGDVERIITAKTYVETMTLGDPEVEERWRFAKEDRRELLPPSAARSK